MEVKKLNRLKVVMAEKDLSNIWLSKKLGVSQATVSKWMTNFSQPNLETLIKISKVLNVEITELIRTEEVQIYGAQNETYIEGWEKKTSNLLIYKRLCKI